MTGRLVPPQGAVFAAVLGGEPEQYYLMASDAGYGFLVRFKDLLSGKKAGKLILSLPPGAKVLSPSPVDDPKTDRLVAITNNGRMLVVPLSELPVLNRGKGNKIIGIPAKRVAAREEFLVALASVPSGRRLTAYAGKRHITFRTSDLDCYQGDRGRRGNKLPRGFQKVDRIAVE